MGFAPKVSPRGPKPFAFDDKALADHKTKEGGAHGHGGKHGAGRVGTQIEFKITFFPNENDESIVYLKNLHMFSEENWISIGIKPKAKDLKSVLEDLEQLDYLKNLSDYTPSVVLDGKKVRIGAQSYLLDPFYETYASAGEKLNKMSDVFGNEKLVEAIMEFSLTLNQKLETILSSEEPLLVEISKGLKLEGSFKFHNKQFKQILETTTEKKYKDFSRKEGAEEEKQGSNADGESNKDADEKESASKEDRESDGSGSGSDEDEDDYDEEEDEDSENNDEEQGGDGEGEEEEKQEDGFSIEKYFQYLLPFFLLKWKSKIELNPDINDIKQYCLRNQEESFLLSNFKKLVRHLKETDLDEAAKEALTMKKKGTKKELLSYLS